MNNYFMLLTRYEYFHNIFLNAPYDGVNALYYNPTVTSHQNNNRYKDGITLFLFINKP